jgi:hypothetical protein
MFNRKNPTLLKAAVEEYTGRTVKELKTYDDPYVAGAFAIRCVAKDDNANMDFVVTAHAQYKTAAELVRELEEACFETWPPKASRKTIRFW